ncbi:MAG TPA: D-alanine--D-alanine ligase [Bacteroidia bacterium]|jgi:UDP-N-acetylmuramate--alanine ligase|nr:D-alanine--D-alanine ligase [Bacteroidia bacterium]
MKLRVGIIFGGFSREREVSFAGGRTVYDNLDKSLFDAIPIFVDSFGNFVLLDWKYIYKGSIRDFYPPVDYLPNSPNNFQVYAESVVSGQWSVVSKEGNIAVQMLDKIGTHIKADEIKKHIDFAFLCLHGAGGEDGSIQGLLEYLKIPYSGSGILSSALGMDKALQRQWMKSYGFTTPDYITLKRTDISDANLKKIHRSLKKKISTPCVIKPSHQGSSIGATVLSKSDYISFEKAIYRSFFMQKISFAEWKSYSKEQQIHFIREMSDIREGIGFPLTIHNSEFTTVVYHPEELLAKLVSVFSKSKDDIVLEAFDGENEVLIEKFLEGKEFSCIVIQDENGNPIALPPTEIRKGQNIFDYRSKYLPGLSRKITPIDLPEKQIKSISESCCKLFSDMHFNVYARIDGFISPKGKVFLNDPNTTSGMLPSSFFFHQAAEIGLNPSKFLTFIIRTSIQQRLISSMHYPPFDVLLNQMDELLDKQKNAQSSKKKIAVILGGYSSERHISVESGRNIYEKLASSTKYEPLPVFLMGNSDGHSLYTIPINVLLKDNADDIREKILNYKIHPFIKKIQENCRTITDKYATGKALLPPRRLTYSQLAKEVDGVFIALHGRPGEDGTVQKELEKVGLPYNGSSVETSAITINKYETDRILRENGMLVADDMIVNKEECKDKNKVYNALVKKLGAPFIAKPIDDGCSSAVRKILSAAEFDAYTKLIFRDKQEKDKKATELLEIRANEEFPIKKAFLAEELISKKGASRFLEITGGLLTHYTAKGKEYEIFEASEALSEGAVLSLEEKFLAGEGQNITPARYAADPKLRQKISDSVKAEFLKAAKLLNIEGYARIDAFVRIFPDGRSEVIFIEVNSLPGMTPATCIFHQTAINGYTPYQFIDNILEYGFEKLKKTNHA